MNFLEKDLEQIVYDADKELLAEKGLTINGKLIRQLRIGNYGITDLVEYRRPYYCKCYESVQKGEITVYELKQNKIGISTFLQALGYLKGIKEYLKCKNMEDNYNYSIVLIGKELDRNSTYHYLTDFLSNSSNDIDIDADSILSLHNYTYEYGLNGIEFKRQHGWRLLNNGF
jgi:hypothetical protein